MSGKPQYVESEVIDAAIDVFWRHGYAAASINDLTAATGLSRSSLYQRFRDKDGLFQEALANYTERVLRRMKAVQSDTMRGRLEALLQEFAAKPGKSTRPAGCLLARSCAEMADLPESGRSVATAGLMKQRLAVEQILRVAVASGELAADADIDGLAWHYLGVLQAILNLPQAGAAPAMVQRMIAIAMTAWPAGRGQPR